MKEFISWFAGLAPEGETALVVRQTPKLLKGALQFHKDGAIKASWPAFLPTHKMRDGQSNYGNTGSFILDRMKDGISASRANCEYVLVLMLDDIGTKSKAPPVAPTWVMETSPGNYQWGFAFSEQPSKGAFVAAVKAMAAAGFTDPGAGNPVRNFRLPGSVNLKPDKGGFVSRLVEFHPTREYTLSELCGAMNVTPGPDEVDGITSLRLKDNGGDDVAAWLSENGFVLEPPNTSGWMGVVCPQAEKHSDGNPEGRYLPSSRAFCCYHSSCEDLGPAAFLSWVAEQGGPEHGPGLREELVAAAMQGALQKLSPTEFFTDDAKKVIAEVERKELGRVEKAGWFERFAYIQSDDSYFDLQDRREISRGTFNALFRHIKCNSARTGRVVEASVSFDELRQDKGGRALVGITYAAGESILVSRDGDVFGNRWRDARPEVPAGVGNIDPWMSHVEALIPDVGEREHVLDVMAYKLQHPEVKINHAILHGGDQGCGKDTLWAPFLWAVCGPGLKNRGLMDNDSLGSQWGYQLEAEIIVINELREPEAASRRALANKLKPIIAAPPEMLPVNRKGLHPYDMVNRAVVLAFSNDQVPISLDSQDRRWFAVWSRAPKMEPDAALALWDWYRSGGFVAVAQWLRARDVSRFNPGAAPAWTEWKFQLVENGMSAGESFLVEMIRARAGEFAKGVVGAPFHAVCDRLAGQAPSGTKVHHQALLHALKEAGWIDMGRLSSHEYQTKKSVWCAPELRGKPKSELRRMIEAEPTRLMAVK